MILQKEIAVIAERSGVAKTVIDKDWVLGHFIAALYATEELSDALVFKGGTCLRKCWFPDYRFSEDLDFTARAKGFEFTSDHLQNICVQVAANAGIRTQVVSLRQLRYQEREVGYEAVVKYWGADHSKNEPPPPPERWQTRIKLEIILYETLLFDPVEKTLSHPYSDELPAGLTIPCYAIEEVLAEKIRALIQRSYTAPRDYYDIWYLSNNVTDLNWEGIAEAFHAKMKYKNLEFTGIDQLINPKNERAVSAAWQNSLGHQIKVDALPEFGVVKNELENLFRKIF